MTTRLTSDGEGGTSPHFIPWRRAWHNNPLLDDETEASHRRILVLSPEVNPAELVEEALPARVKPWLIKNRNQQEEIQEGLANEFIDELDRMFSDEPAAQENATETAAQKVADVKGGGKSTSDGSEGRKVQKEPDSNVSIKEIKETSVRSDSELHTSSAGVGLGAVPLDRTLEGSNPSAGQTTNNFSMQEEDRTERRISEEPPECPHSQNLSATQAWLDKLSQHTVPNLLASFEEFRNTRLVLQQLILAYSICKLQVPLPLGMPSVEVTEEDYITAKDILSRLNSAYEDALRLSSTGPIRSDAKATNENGGLEEPLQQSTPEDAVYNAFAKPSPQISFVIGPHGTVISAQTDMPKMNPSPPSDEHMTDSTASTAATSEGPANDPSLCRKSNGNPSPVRSPPTRKTPVAAKKAAVEPKSVRGKRTRAAGTPSPADSAIPSTTRKKRRSRAKPDAANPGVKEETPPPPANDIDPTGNEAATANNAGETAKDDSSNNTPRMGVTTPEDPEGDSTPALPKFTFCKLHGEFNRVGHSGCPTCAEEDRAEAAANGFVLLRTTPSHLGKTYELQCRKGHIGVYSRLAVACDTCVRLLNDRKNHEQQQQKQQQRMFDEAKCRFPHGLRQPRANNIYASVTGKYPENDATGALTVERLMACRSLRLIGWEVLGIPRPRTAQQLANAMNQAKLTYKKLVMRVHPDKCQHPQSKEAFHILDTAWKAIQRNH